MRVEVSGTSEVVISITSTTGGGKTGASGFLQLHNQKDAIRTAGNRRRARCLGPSMVFREVVFKLELLLGSRVGKSDLCGALDRFRNVCSPSAIN
jgi:hypothetical protein